MLASAGENVSISHGLSLDATHVYWSEQGARVAIAKVMKAGGERELVVETEDIPFAIGLNSTSIFWTEGGFDVNRLRSLPKSGGKPTDLFTDREDMDDAIATEARVFFSWQHFGGNSDIASFGLLDQMRSRLRRQATRSTAPPPTLAASISPSPSPASARAS